MSRQQCIDLPLSEQKSEDVNQCGNNSWNINDMLEHLRKNHSSEYRLDNVRITKSRIYFFFAPLEG